MWKRAVPIAIALALGTVGGYLVGRSRAKPAPIATVEPALAEAPMPSCVKEIEARLDENDPWTAQSKLAACDDPLAEAETKWMLGEVDLAGKAWLRARNIHPSVPFTLSEIEAVAIADPAAGAAHVRKAKADWYRGPPDIAQARVDGIANWLEGKKEPWRLVDRSRVHKHFLPAYALHQSGTYFQSGLLGEEVTPESLNLEWDDCHSHYKALDDVAVLACQASIAANRALFWAVAGIQPKLDSEWQMLGRLEHAQEVFDRPISHKLVWEDEPEPPALTFSIESTGTQLVASQALFVGAVSAWVAHDETHMNLFLARAEAHARGILEEHLELVSGKKTSPEPSHSPSDYGAPDMELFATIDATAPEAFVAKLKNLHFDSPARLEAFFASRPRFKPALDKWASAEFVPPCRSCGLYELLAKSYSRRAAARLAGNAALEAKLLAVTQGLGEAWMRSRTLDEMIALEDLLSSHAP